MTTGGTYSDQWSESGQYIVGTTEATCLPNGPTLLLPNSTLCSLPPPVPHSTTLLLPTARCAIHLPLSHTLQHFCYQQHAVQFTSPCPTLYNTSVTNSTLCSSPPPVPHSTTLLLPTARCAVYLPLSHTLQHARLFFAVVSL